MVGSELAARRVDGGAAGPAHGGVHPLGAQLVAEGADPLGCRAAHGIARRGVERDQVDVRGQRERAGAVHEPLSVDRPVVQIPGGCPGRRRKGRTFSPKAKQEQASKLVVRQTGLEGGSKHLLERRKGLVQIEGDAISRAILLLGRLIHVQINS
jgi:hypothetical protein